MRIRDGLSGWDGGVARLRGGRLALVSGLLGTALLAVLAGALAIASGCSSTPRLISAPATFIAIGVTELLPKRLSPLPKLVT